MHINISSGSLVYQIKDEIAEQNGVPPYKQQLVLNNGNKLDDNKKISECLQNYAQIHLKLILSKIQIFIENEFKEKITLVIDLEDTIKNIKDLYYKKTNKRIVTFSYNTKSLDNQDNIMKAIDYGIQENSTLFAFVRFHGGKIKKL